MIPHVYSSGHGGGGGNPLDLLVSKAREYLETDPSSAKAWLITAKTLFPKEFSVQFEAYAIEKAAGNVKQAGLLLKDLVFSSDFENESRLWEEMSAIAESLRNDYKDDSNNFHKTLFQSLPTHVQEVMLLKVADRCTDIIEHARVKLLILEMFPSLMQEHGTNLIERLIAAEKQYQQQYGLEPSPVNPYRKMLVCDVLPVVLARISDPQQKNLYRWIQKSIDFCINYITQPHLLNAAPPTEESAATGEKGGAEGGGGGAMGVSCASTPPTDPWPTLFEILDAAGVELGWAASKGIFKLESREAQWAKILSLYQHMNYGDPSGAAYKQLLYITIVLFLNCVSEYMYAISQEQFVHLNAGSSSSDSSGSVPLVMIESFSGGQHPHPHNPVVHPHAGAAPGAIGGPPAIHVGRRYQSHGSGVSGASAVAGTSAGEIRVIADFLTALKCYELLNSHQNIQKDLQKLLASWRSDTWTWFNEFHIDLSIYQGMFSEAAHAVTNPTHPPRSKKEDLRRHLQLASSLFCLGKYSSAVERAIFILGLLGAPEDDSSSSSPSVSTTPYKLFSCLPSEDPPATPGRLVQLLPCTDLASAKGDLVAYCVEMIVIALKTRIFIAGINDDRALGHLVVMSQYAWPKYSSLFLDVIKRIQRQGSFAYTSFCSYVVVVDILEEFAYLRTPEGGRITLDILPVATSSSSSSSGRSVTRGANRGAAEDFRTLIESQVYRTHEIDLDTVVKNFFAQEQNSLLQILEC